MSTNNDTTTVSAAPTRGPVASIDNLLARGRWSVKHYGPNLGALFLDAMNGLVDRLRELIGMNREEASTIAVRAAALVAERRKASADGVITTAEGRRLARAESELIELTGLHRDHAKHLTT